MNTIETKAGHTLDSVAALSAAERLVRLFKDPQPGMATWCMFLATAMADFDKAVGCVPDSVERAAPELLEACEAALNGLYSYRDIEGNCSARSERDMLKAAISKAKAEGRA